MFPSKESQTASRSFSHLELLVMLVAVLTLQSFLDGSSGLERIVVNLSFFALVLSSIRSLSASVWRLRTALLLGLLALLGSMTTEFYRGQMLVNAVYLANLGVLGVLLLSLLESVFSLGPTSIERIIGAISIYVILALAWAFAYTLLELNWPGSFNLDRPDTLGIHTSLINEMFYFSGATLTTLGYGDIVVVSKPGRMLAVTEAMTGQLYIAVVIAHLVGERIAQSVK